MERAIKFRAWDGAKNAWLHEAKTPDMAIHLVGETIMFGELWRRPDDTGVPMEEMNQVIWEQYTGLKDCNGKEIYDGDIVVKHDYPFYSEGNRNYVGIVNWVYAAWYYDIERVSDRVRGAAVGGMMDDDGLAGSDFEVIGNIHENPELLELVSSDPS